MLENGVAIIALLQMGCIHDFLHKFNLPKNFPELIFQCFTAQVFG